MNIQTVGVIGGGIMGRGVAQNLAQKWYQVILLDVSDQILIKAKQEILLNIRFHGFYTKETKTAK